MSSENYKQVKPVISVIIIVMTFFAIVFFQMEERRIGYSLLKLTREHKDIIDHKRQLEINLARITQPQLMTQIAHRKGELKKLQPYQIIHLSGSLMDRSKDEDL